jgi:DtxR family transcriptional regulator, Mn-dependent transcriptional regulator
MASVRTNELTASLEDYLEAIFQIVQDKQAVRAKDIGKRLEVGRSSVTGALHALADRELINYAPYDVISLTESGQTLAKQIVRRHEVLRDFFVKVLSVDPADAEAAACKMEHAIPENVMERFVEFVDFVDRCPDGGAQWREGIGYTCEHGIQAAACDKCERLIDEAKE